MKQFALILLIIAIVGVAIYAVFTQISGNIKLNNLISPSLFDYSINSSPSTPTGGSSGSGSTNTPPPSTTPLSPTSPIPPPITPPAGFTRADLSPYYQKVRLTNVIPPSGYYNPTGISQFSLQWSNSTSTLIDVTGWQVKGNRGATVVVPQAVPDYMQSAFFAEREGDIVLDQNGYLTVYSSRSPLNANLRLNKCTGYLNDQYTFARQLPENCPSIDRSVVATFSGDCQAFVFSIGNCSVPTPDQRNRYGYDSACSAFLNKLDYSGCYAAHRGDANFFSNEWRAWTDQEMPFNSAHDRILLLDNNGLLVDIYTY